MATELVIQPSAKDNYFRENSPTINYGSATDLMLWNLNGYTRRTILEFDLSEIPIDATIISASLRLYYRTYADTNPSGKTVWAYKLTRTDWEELQSTWNTYKTGSSWTTPGGDYVTSAPAGASTTFPAGYGWMSWNVLAIVQDAFGAENPAEFLMKFATEGLAVGYSLPRWYSNNYTIDPSLYPKLVIEYTIPAVAGRSFGFIIG